MPLEIDKLGWTSTVGDVIQSLFPDGFSIDKYINFIADNANDIENRNEIVNSLTREERKLQGYLQKRFNSDPLQDQQVAQKYLTLPYSPFDMFAITSMLIKNSGCYHHIMGMTREPSPTLADSLPRRMLIVDADDRKLWEKLGRAWRKSRGSRSLNKSSKFGVPKEIVGYWLDILWAWNKQLFKPEKRNIDSPTWWKSAVALHIISDMAAEGAGISSSKNKESNSVSIWAFIAVSIIENSEDGTVHTLSRAARDYVSILPKTRTAEIGITLRSLSQNLAALPVRGSVRATWAWQASGYRNLGRVDQKPFNMVLIPYPFKVSAKCFRPIDVQGERLKQGKFEFVPNCERQFESGKRINSVPEMVMAIYEKCKERVETIHAIVLPELSLTAYEFLEISRMVEEKTNVELLCAGLRERFPDSSGEVLKSDWKTEQSNQCVMVSFPRLEKSNGELNARPRAIGKYEKHHRWKLNGQQIMDYGLSSSLDPSFDWWENIHTLNRELPFMVMRDRWLATTLICEDLARIDPAQEMVRAIGPNLVIALLMDGPQLSNRWSARYATILADDPGSAVLTLNSFGLVGRSSNVRKIEKNEDVSSRAIALWRDDLGVSTPIEMPPGHHAVCLTIAENFIEEVSLDFRISKPNRVALRLSNYVPIKIDETM